MRGMRAIVAIHAICAYLTPCPSAQELPASIERYLNSQVLENDFSGAVLVAHGSEVFIDRNFAPPSVPGSKLSDIQYKFPTGSITEQFIAGAILQLELAGRVSLDSSICKYLSGCPSQWEQIHILHLLTHSSGLPSLEGVPSCVKHSVSQFNSSAMIAMLSERSLLFKPGSKFNANKLDYFFLSLAIEKVSGESTAAYLKEHIFHPLKLVQTGNLDHGPEQNPVEIKGQVSCPHGEHATNPLSSFTMDQLYTTTGDLYRWERALTTGKLLPKNSLDQMLTPQIEGYGFGWKILKEFDRKVALQNNELEPTSVSIRVYPDDDTYIIVVSRSTGLPSSAISHDLGAILFGKHYPVSPNPARPGSL
jgi:CubicO group peptidase (beta-lactamase class C family)